MTYHSCIVKISNELDLLTYNIFLQSVSSNTNIDVKQEDYNLSLIYQILENDRVFKKVLREKINYKGYLNKYFESFKKLDYYDLLILLTISSKIVEFNNYEKDILKLIKKENRELSKYFYENKFGLGAYAILLEYLELKNINNVLTTQQSSYIKNKLLILFNTKKQSNIDVGMYNLSKLKDKLFFTQLEISNFISTIVNNQNSIGSWGGKQAYYTSFALDNLNFFIEKERLDSKYLLEKAQNSFEKGINFLLTNKSYKGYPNTIITTSKFLNDLRMKNEKSNSSRKFSKRI